MDFIEFNFALRLFRSVQPTIFIECSHWIFRKSNHRSLLCKNGYSSVILGRIYWSV